MYQLKGRVFVTVRPQGKEFHTNLEPGGHWRVVVINYFPILPSHWEVCNRSKQINITLVLARRPPFSLGEGAGEVPGFRSLTTGVQYTHYISGCTY